MPALVEEKLPCSSGKHHIREKSRWTEALGGRGAGNWAPTRHAALRGQSACTTRARHLPAPPRVAGNGGEWGACCSPLGGWGGAVLAQQLLEAHSCSGDLSASRCLSLMWFRIVPGCRESPPIKHTHHRHTPLSHLPFHHYTWPPQTNPISALNSKAKKKPSYLILLVVTMLQANTWRAASHQPGNRWLWACWERLLKEEIWHLLVWLERGDFQSHVQTFRTAPTFLKLLKSFSTTQNMSLELHSRTAPQHSETPEEDGDFKMLYNKKEKW